MTFRKAQLLLISALPPPLGGVAAWTETLLNQGLERYDINFIDTRLLGRRQVFGKVRYSIFIEVYRNSAILLRLFFNLVRRRPSLVHINGGLSTAGGLFRLYCCLILCRIFFVPTVVQHNGNIEVERFFKKKPVRRSFLIGITKIASQTIVLNQISYDALLQVGASRINAKRIVVFPLFISKTFISRMPNYASRLSRSGVTFVFLGGVVKAKGVLEIVALARIFSEARFVLIGWILPEMRSVIDSSPDNVVFLGAIQERDIICEHLMNSDCFLFPSYTEGFPVAVLEAMGSGLPVVATKVGAIPEMVDANKGGFVVDLGDFPSLQNACDSIIKSPKNKLVEMGKYNREKVIKNYSYQTVTKQLENLYDQVVADCSANRHF